jgi:ribonuclease Z
LVKLSVTFLGTSSAAPTKGRGLPAIGVRREGELVLMDCGEGVQRQLMSEGLGLNRETTVLITHLHGDHVTGLLGLLQTMGLAQRTRPLTVVGPAPLLGWLEKTYEALHMGLTFELRFVPARPGRLLSTKSFVIRAAKASHSIDAFGYRLDEHPRPGVFHPERAKRLGVPEGRMWSRLQKGRAVRVGGVAVAPSQVMGPERPGRSIGYSGDTRPTKRLVKFFAGCDLLIFDSTFSDKDAAKAVERKHSTAREAAALARAARAKSLALTHFSARYVTPAPLLREARSVFRDTFAASDGLTVDV